MNDYIEAGARSYGAVQPLLTPCQLAKLCGVSAQVVSAWRKRGCPCVCIGRTLAGRGSRPRFDFDAVRLWLESRSSNQTV